MSGFARSASSPSPARPRSPPRPEDDNAQSRSALAMRRRARSTAWARVSSRGLCCNLPARAARRRLNGSVHLSDRFEFDQLAEQFDCLSQNGGAETEGALDDAGLASDVTRDIEGRCLSFAERVHHFEAFDRCVGRLQRLEASDRSDQLLQLPMVRFNDVVHIFDLPVQRLLGTSALLLQLGQSGGVGRRLVGVDDPRLLPVLQAAQRLAEKALRRRRVARRGEVEVYGVPMLVDGPVEIGPLAADLHVGLVDAPAGRARPAPLPTQPFLDLGRVFLNPAVDRRMVDRDAALAHHLLEITIAHPVAAIPPDRPEHDLTLEVAPLEVRHGPLPSLALDPSRRRTVGFATEPAEEVEIAVGAAQESDLLPHAGEPMLVIA